MDGLEKIIRKIEEDAENTASAIISDAENAAEKITFEAEVRAGMEEHDIITAAKTERDAMLRKTHSHGELIRKNKILSRKVTLIEQTVSKAVLSFMNEDPAKYFDSMLRLAGKYALEGKQEMVFSDKDIERLPEDFSKKLRSAVGKRADITIRGGGSFAGGFLLISEDMVENCTVEALIGANETEIRDELCRILFIG
ncbi:MAG: hypothetical protein IJ386_02440 [Clostridia bacterium]|nr:hypothetical protein [Clostridia bacterium]